MYDVLECGHWLVGTGHAYDGPVPRRSVEEQRVALRELEEAASFAWRLGAVGAQGLAEYGLLIALVALLAVAGLLVLAPALDGLFSGLHTPV